MGHPPKQEIRWVASPLLNQHELSRSVSPKHGPPSENSSDPENSFPVQIDDSAMHATPQFQRHEEATNIELFYDLFFVANLTTFTGLHEINTSKALEAYIGYFCLLWFAWCQVIMFDVRYVTDSIIERAAKACQFGVMVGFAVVGPNFDPNAQQQQVFKTLSIILAVSRFLLSGQYLMVMWHVKKYKGAKLPLVSIALSNFLTAIIYLVLAFTFPSQGNSKNYVAWYVIAVAETAFNIAVSSKWKVVSFKGTHLVQRMSLLTLIILGEGIIVVCESVAKIVKNENAWSAATIGTLTSAVTLVYFLYMIYFDWLSHVHFGNIRQQIWAFLHFPFHLALVLFMEGTAQFLIWHKIIEALNLIENTFVANTTSWPTTTKGLTSFVNSVNETVQAFIDTYPPVFQTTYDEIDEQLTEMADSALDSDKLQSALFTLLDVIQSSLFTTYGIEAPEDDTTSGNVEEELEKQSEVFGLVFTYFFITAGLTIILMNVLYYLSMTHVTNGKLRDRKLLIFRLVFNTIIGAAICLLAIFAVNGNIGSDFAMSAWVLPAPTIGLLLILLVANVKIPGIRQKQE